MWIVRLALRRPYTFVVMSVAILLLGATAIVTMPVDIFPYIDIPVVSVVWTYGGVPPRRDGASYSDYLRTRHDHHRERYRAYRIAIVLRRLGGSRLLPTQRESGYGDSAD